MLQARFFLADQVINEHPSRREKPRVSVILPTFCRGDNGLLERAIESVLSQSFADFELLIIDDGSTDKTAEVCARYVHEDRRVVHIRHDMNSGLPALRVNEGIMLARGEYIAYQFDDDVWTADALKLRVEGLDANPDYGVAYGRASVVHGDQVGHLGGPFDFSKLLNENYIANNTVMHRKSLFEQYGGYDMHLVMRRLCDWDLWLRWARETRFLFIDAVLSHVEGMMEGSLGLTAHQDQFSSRFMIGMDRNKLLTPENLPAYQVDDLSIFESLGKEKLNEIWRQNFAPFRERREYLRDVIQPIRPARLNVLVTKAHFDTNVDITITNLSQHLRDRYTFTYIPSAQLDVHALQTADIVIFHRTMDDHAEKMLKAAKALGKATAYLMDDDLLTMHELNDEFVYLRPGQPTFKSLTSHLALADVTIAYSRLMEESASKYSQNVAQLTTNIESRWLKQIERPNNARLRIAFAGGGARKDEMTVLREAITKLSRKYEDKLEFHFWGCKPEGIEDIPSPVFFEPFTFSYNEYLGRLTKAGFDIVLVPLFAEKRAKAAKCPIKFLEGTAAGAIGLYSDTEPYAAVEDGVTGFKCDNKPKAWVKAIERAIKMRPSERTAMLERARKVVLDRFSSEAQAKELDNILEKTWEAAITSGPEVFPEPAKPSAPIHVAPIHVDAIKAVPAPRKATAGAFSVAPTCDRPQICVHAGKCVRKDSDPGATPICQRSSWALEHGAMNY
ncbi:MAG TPA: glycosyltransferase [Paraburkholderia sp.]